MDTKTDTSLLEFDEDGFLTDPWTWTERLAQYIARQDGIGTLTPSHWIIIKTLREHYRRVGTPPAMRHICHMYHLNKNCVTTLFGDSSKKAWRIAGLPNPGEEAKSYM